MISYSLPLVMKFLVLFTHDISSNVGLEQGDNPWKTLFTHVFKITQYTSLKEDFCASDFVFVRVHLESGQNLSCYFFAIVKSCWYSISSQDRVSVNIRSILEYLIKIWYIFFLILSTNKCQKKELIENAMRNIKSQNKVIWNDDIYYTM